MAQEPLLQVRSSEPAHTRMIRVWWYQSNENDVREGSHEQEVTLPTPELPKRQVSGDYVEPNLALRYIPTRF
jgi:hypothetical protein